MRLESGSVNKQTTFQTDTSVCAREQRELHTADKGERRGRQMVSEGG